jgi:hypothetical protein
MYLAGGESAPSVIPGNKVTAIAGRSFFIRLVFGS